MSSLMVTLILSAASPDWLQGQGCFGLVGFQVKRELLDLVKKGDGVSERTWPESRTGGRLHEIGDAVARSVIKRA
jgi:hypothetical protein